MEMCHSTIDQPGPYAAPGVGYEAGASPATHLLPQHLLDEFAVDQMHQTVVSRADPQAEPQAASVVASDRMHTPWRRGRHRRKPLIFEHRKAVEAGNPNATALILEERLDLIVGQARIASLAINRYAPALPSIKPIGRADPYAAIARGENVFFIWARKPFRHRARGDRRLAKLIETL